MARFSNGTPARFVITDLTGAITTILDRSLLQGEIQANFLQSWQITFSVRSNDPAVNVIFSDGDPLLAQSNRLVYVFIREDPDSGGAWVCRASGICMSPQDQADADTGTTRFIAYDPWEYLFGRPCWADGSGTQIGPNGILFTAAAFPGGAAQIAATLLAWTIESEGVGCFIDAGLTYAGTFHWTGTIEDTPAIDFTVQQGMTLGDAWNQLVSTGDNPASSGPFNGCDIVLEPIWDPTNRPGYLSQLSIYNLAGNVEPVAEMSWATFNRTATTADREHDGTPGNFINEADFRIGQGGLQPTPGFVPTNAASVAKYQPYWQTQFFPGQNSGETVEALAYQALTLGKQGKRTFTVDVDPIRCTALPFRDYNPGDFIPVLAPNAPAKLRVLASGNQRIMTIPVQINPDGVTAVRSLQTTPDWRH